MFEGKLNKVLLLACAVMVAVCVSRFGLIFWAVKNLAGMADFGRFGVLQERVLGERGRQALARGDLQLARASYEASLAIDPHSDYRRELAYTYLRLGELERAEALCRSHLSEFVWDGAAYLVLAEISAKRGRPPIEVRAILERGVERVSRTIEDYSTLEGEPEPQHHRKQQRTVDALIAEKGKLDKAIEAVDKIIAEP